MPTRPRFTIVIPTAGRVSSLRRCLIALSCHACVRSSDWEVLVVDNNSDPSLSDAVREAVALFPFFTYVRCESPGSTAARHLALQCAHGEVFCYLDDDVDVTSSWFASIDSAFSDPSVALAGGPSIPSFRAPIPAWFWDFLAPTPYGGWCCVWLSLLDLGCDVDAIDPLWIWGLNFAIRRQVLLDCGGFHLDLVPSRYRRWQGDGETGLALKLAQKGYKAVYRQASLVYHLCGADRLCQDYFVRRASFQGVCNSYTELRRQLRPDAIGLRAVGANVVAESGSLSEGAASDAAESPPPASPPDCLAPSRWSAAAAEVWALCHQAEGEGYAFHQQEAAADPALLAWIARDHYLDVDLRQLAGD